MRYVQIDTQARRDRERSPSTPGQLELGALLVKELLAAGLEDASQDENGYVTASPGRDAGRRSAWSRIWTRVLTRPARASSQSFIATGAAR